MLWNERIIIKFKYFFVLGTLSLFLSPFIQASTLSASDKIIHDKIEKKIAQSGYAKSDLGIWVGESLVGASYIYELNSSQLFLPASLSKALTAYATFSTFPLDHKFKTQLLTNDKVEGNKLDGDLILKGGGDPAFVSESLWVLVNHFTRSGINEIAGNIIVDDSLFDGIRYDESREDKRVDRAYDAPVGAMSFNWNSVNIYVKPGKNKNDPGVVIADPISPYIKIINKTKTVNGKTNKFDLRVSRVEDKTHIGDSIIVAGEIGLQTNEQVYYASITQPDMWSGIQLVEFLKQRGIQVKGQVIRGVSQMGARVLAEVESPELSRLVSDMMKFSNNYVAEMLTKNIAVYRLGQTGTLENGVSEIRKIMETKLGYQPNEYNFINPSGLTRKNRIRPKDLAKLFNNAKSNFQFFPEFIHSLAVSGVDGTLKNRFSKSIALKVRGKTGLLNGVNGLAGYLEQPNGRILTIVFLYNGTQDDFNRLSRFYEEIIKLMSFDTFSEKSS